MKYLSLRTPTPNELAAFLTAIGEPVQLIPDETLIGMEVKMAPALLKALTTWQNQQASRMD